MTAGRSPILGKDTCRHLQLVKRVNAMKMHRNRRQHTNNNMGVRTDYGETNNTTSGIVIGKPEVHNLLRKYEHLFVKDIYMLINRYL